uniref:Shadow of prion protein n=1 Tax=Denticeps clupeoides TaxID=299321 RepID=A0AAY4AIH5_9TELE
MAGQRKLLLLWAWMLLMAALCPGAHCKRGGGFKSRGKGVGTGAKAPPSQSQGSSKQGLKLAGAAAAGALGGAAVGYGLGSLGRNRYGHGYGYGQDRDSSEEDSRFYPDGAKFYNRSEGRYYRNSANPRSESSVLIALGPLASLLLGNWMGFV